MSRLSVFVSSAEGFTATYTARELIRSGAFRSVGVGCNDPSQTQDLAKLCAKVHKMPAEDVDGKAKELRGYDILVLVPPAQSRKTEISIALIDAAEKAGIRTIVLLSMMPSDTTTRSQEAQAATGAMKPFADIEAHLRSKHSLQFVIVRLGFYIQNVLLYRAQLEKERILPAPAGEGRWAPVNLKDVAKFVLALIQPDDKSGLAVGELNSKHVGQTYTLTGPLSLTATEMCAKMSDVLEIPITYNDITPQQAKQILNTISWLDDSEKLVLLDTYDLIKNSKYDLTTNDYKQVTGSEPSTIEDFVLENKGELKIVA